MTPKISPLSRSADRTTITQHPELVEIGRTARRAAGGSAPVIALPVRRPAVEAAPPADVASIREQVLDRLVARIGFGRTCVQICDALLKKLGAAPHHGPSRGDLEQLRAEDLRHLMTARELILKLGGDPTVLSPRASMQVPVSASLCQLAADPRTSVADALDTLLVAEVVDREAWEQLAAESAPLGDAELEAQLCEVRRAVGEHVVRVRAWLAAATATAARPRD